MSVDADGPLRLQLFSPIPPVPEEDHGGLKLDWRSDVGRTGALLEWRVPVRSVDAGMPTEVAQILAVALCRVATVTGCTLTLPPGVGAAWAPVPGGQACRFDGPWWRRSRDDIGLLASRDPAVVARFFDDDTFPWSLENQLLVLSAPDAVPALDRAAVEACFAVPMRITRAQLVEAEVTGLLRAGVDGDVAGLYVPAPDARETVERALADATRAAGAHWEVRDGAEHWSVRPPAAGASAAAQNLPN